MKISHMFLVCSAMLAAQPTFGDPPRRTRDPAHDAQKQQPTQPAKPQEAKKQAQATSNTVAAKQPIPKPL